MINQNKIDEDKKEMNFDDSQYDIHDESDDNKFETENQNEKFKEVVKKISSAS